MKKLIIIASLAFANFAGYAQSIELSGKGSFKATGIFNKNLSDRGDDQDYRFPSWGNSYGLGATFYFTPNIGFGVEGLFGEFTGKYEGIITGVAYTSETVIKSFDIPLMLKFQTKTGGSYVELGVQYSKIKSVQYTGESPSYSISEDVTKKYSDSNLAALLGLGVNIDLTKRLFLTTGVRFEYGLSDIKGVDAQKIEYSNLTIYPTQNKTWTAAAGIFLGVMFRLGKTADK